MKNLVSIEGRTDEELLAEYSIEVDGRTFVPAGLLDAIGERQVKKAGRKPGDPGTIENPVFKEGKAYVYGKRNHLILWEDYSGPIPSSEDRYIGNHTESYTVTAKMQPTEEQKRMVHRVQKMPVVITTDCPLIPSEALSSFTRFRYSRPVVTE